MSTRLDWNVLDAQIKKLSDDFKISESGKAFPVYIVSRLLQLTIEDALDCITDGTGDEGIDAFYLHDSGGAFEVHVFNCRYFERPAKMGNNFPGNEVRKVLSFLREFLDKEASLTSRCNRLLAHKVNAAWEKLDSPHFRLIVYFCSNSARMTEVDRGRVDQFKTNFTFCQTCEFGLTDIVKKIVRSGDFRVDANLRLYGREFISRSTGAIKGVLATVQAPDFVEMLLEKSSDKSINHAMFHENIRPFLGIRNEVNQNILRTALNDDASVFWYLNNGITIVCDRLRYNNVASPQASMENIQIVNGGQTSYALFEAYKQDKEKLQDVFVMVRIYETDDEEFKIKISESTNNQTKITARDLKSNHSTQRKIEQILLPLGYFYQRKQRMYEDKPHHVVLDPLRVGQTMLSYYHGEPDKAKTQSDRIFSDFFSLIFDEDMSAEKILTPFKLAKEIEAEKELARTAMNRKKTLEVENEFLIEGSFHVLFVVGLLCKRDGISLEEHEQARKRIDEAIRVTRETAKNFRQQSYYRFFRSVRAKEVLKETVGPQQLALQLT